MNNAKSLKFFLLSSLYSPLIVEHGLLYSFVIRIRLLIGKLPNRYRDVKYVKELLETIQKDMYDRAVKRRDALTFEAHNYDEMRNILDTQPGFIHGMWCGDEACELKIKELNGCKSRCILEGEKAIDKTCVCCGKPAKYHVIWGIQY